MSSSAEDIIKHLNFDALEKELCEMDLLEFTKAAWPVIEPGREFKVNWHMEAIAEHLEAVSRGEIKRLCINVWPRSSKSTIVSVMWPVWEWLTSPHLNWLYVSASASTATRDAIKSREIVNSAWYQHHWADRFQFLPDQNEKTKVKNDKGGTRNIYGVTSKVTGENADRLVYDDPNDASDARSTKGRMAVIEAHEDKFRTRLNDIAESTIVNVQQRLHEQDLTGMLLQQDGWEHLVLPMEYDGQSRSRTSLGFIDPRTKDGELADPARFPPTEIENLKKPRVDAEGNVTGGQTFYATQYQQRPQTVEGGIVKREWWQWYDPKQKPQLINRVKSYDTAYKEGQENDPSAMTMWAQEGGNHYITDIWEARVPYPELKRFMAQDFDDRPVPQVLIEDKASGQSLLQEFKTITTPNGRKMPVFAMTPGGSTKDPNTAQYSMPSSKEERVHFVSALIEAGQVWLPKGHPLALKLVDQFANFPNGANDDILDTVTQRLCLAVRARRVVSKKREAIF